MHPKPVGAHIRQLLDERQVARVEYQPGDGTRYDIVFAPLHDGVVCVTLVNFGTGYVFDLLGPRVDPPHWTYVSEKLFGGRPTSSAVAIHELLAAVIGVDPWITQEEYERQATRAL